MVTKHRMDSTEFGRLLHNGHGRALLYLRDHDAAPHREAILYACRHNTVYDRQAEGSNAEYIFEAIGLTGEAAFYRNALIDALRHPADAYHLGQICDLLRCFAQQGDQGARQALFDALNEDPATYEAMFAIVDFDSLPGFLRVAERIGPSADEDDDFWEGEYFLRQLEDELGKDTVHAAIDAASAANPRIAAYLAAIEREAAKSKSRRRLNRVPPEITYDQLMDLFNSQDKPSLLWMQRWGKQASGDDLRRLANDLAVETNPYKLRSFLRAFVERTFPLDYGLLVSLIDHSDEHVAFVAAQALAAITHPDLHAYALIMLRSERAWIGLKVLVNQFRPGDHILVEGLLRAQYEQPSGDNHRTELDAIALFEQHPIAEATVSLLLIYEHTRCTYCRKDCVFLLHQLGTLPESIRQECEFDAYPRLRSAARRNFSENGDSSAA